LTDSTAAFVGIIAGGFFLSFALLISLALLDKGDAGLKFAVPAFFSLVGGGLIAGSALSLPKWARKQEKQMEHISRYAVSLLALPGTTDD
jgi:hypothetical protein